ncbi:hypothetical protein [Paeniglutamicibacter terrestris]|uniref:Alpha/beta hydrolase n=1 Tax=Paeniglutamicibacter terrestris TaxID=2723403 RepID=A0ABX1G7E7_9MICC|nr:hypothetical protein [Paeniglutamicibacter terrestris]NKG22192.1 hypothetical protein [Paeniglutamicibacter terrestris]
MAIHPIYKSDVIHLDSLDSFQPKPGDEERIHTINIGDGMELGLMVGMPTTESDVLRVGFHAAKSAKDPRVHMFSPLALSRESEDPYILFSDPTLTLSDSTILSWYLGTPEVDPDDWMELLVRRMMEATGAKYLLVEGSSAGGFTAMRFAARFRFAVAVPKIPQTDLFRYREGPLANTMRAAGWTGMGYERVMAECPQRFRTADIYNDRNWNRGNIVQYVQNVGDTWHVNDHLTPFLAELGASRPDVFSAAKGQFAISRPFTGAGHVGIPRPHWVAEAKFALNRLRKMRPLPEPESPWEKPSTFVLPANLHAVREANIRAHSIGNVNW